MFGRSKETTAPSGASSASGDQDSTKPGGKGRPTPKRSEAEKGRRRAVAAPRDRKEAYKKVRERQREERGRSMQALRTGDERHLPARDRGPVRRYARDMVDARRSVAEFFLPLAFLILVLIWAGNEQLKGVGNALWLAVVVLVVVDSMVLGIRLKRGLRQRFPDESQRGALPYALMRSMQIRRFRLPPPRVRAGRRRSRRG
ncbi:MAG TPA: DUF3043 domain-containing protein [Actinomycetes bacterium]